MSDSSSASGSRQGQSRTKAERLAGALNDFLAASPDMEATAVVSFDGLVMASALPPEMDEDRLGAMSAALLSLGEQAAAGLGRGELNQVFVEGQHGYVFLMSAKDQSVLAAVTGRAAKIGLMLFEMRRAAEAVGEILAPATGVPAASADGLGAATDAAGAGEPPSEGEEWVEADEARPHNGATPAGTMLPPWN